MAPRRPPANDQTPDRTPKKEWPERFLLALARTGNVTKACASAKIARDTAYLRRADDENFARAWTTALEIATELLEAEARRRAYDGVLKPIYQGKKLVGKVREYSDTLLIFLLKAHKPEKYRENARVVHAGDPSAPLAHQHEHGGTVNVVNIFSRIDELVAQFDKPAAIAGQGESDPPRDGVREPVDPGPHQGGPDPAAG